jgi:hypothetical protein
VDDRTFSIALRAVEALEQIGSTLKSVADQIYQVDSTLGKIREEVEAIHLNL